MILVLLSTGKDAIAQIYTVTYEDNRYMDCLVKGLYMHCSPKRDLPDGKWRFLYEDTGHIAMIAHISDNDWNGPQFRYRNNGVLNSLYIYKNGKLNGVARTYYSNGQLHFKSNYIDGKTVGDFIAYDSLGSIIRHEFIPFDSIWNNNRTISNFAVFADFITANTLDSLSSKNSIEKIIINGVQIYSIQHLNILSKSFRYDVYIGQSRDSVLKTLGMDFYIMDEGYVDYAIDSLKAPIYILSGIPANLLRCYFENDIVSRIVIVTNATKTYQQLSLILKQYHPHKINAQ